MAFNLTDQVRDIARVVTARSNGDLTRAVTVHAEGELGDLKNTINLMGTQLNSFADQASGALRAAASGRQAEVPITVPGLSGRWKELSEVLNETVVR